MKAAELNENELTALAGLAKYVLLSDKILTPEENIKLIAVTEKIGKEKFRRYLDRFEKTCPDIESFKAFLKKIENQDARESIYNIVFELATVDSIDNNETSLLNWLETEWQIKIGIDDDTLGEA